MIESVMSVMEGDEGMDRQNIKNCFYFQGKEDRFGETENTQKFLEI